MFAPAAPLARAVSKARTAASQTASEIQDDIHVAERLYAQATHPEDEGQEVPEELDADEAEEVIEDEYRPLMDGEEGEEGRDGEAGGKAAKGKRKRWDEEGGETKVRKFEVWLAQLIFFILGACILLSWNTEIVAGAYFGARLVGSPFQTSFASFVALTFTTGNLAFLAHANATQGGANLSRRIQSSIVTLILILVIFIVSTQVKEIPANLFFAYLIVSAVILAASASYLQNAVVALSASFGPRFLNQILSGQGAIAFAVAGIQFAAAYGAVKNQKPESPSSAFRLQADYALSDPQLVADLAAAVPPPAVRQTAFTFFLTVGIFAAVSLVSYWVLLRLPLYRLVIRASFDEDAATTKPKQAASSTSLHVVERKVRHLGIAMLLIFAVTLAVFPSITATIVSVKTGEPDVKLFQRPELFVPLGFAVFAAGDWLGRVMPQWEKLAWTNWKILMGISVARLIFVPLFLMCNQTAGGAGRAIIRSDVAFFLIMFAFAVSNGYISTLIMLASVVEPSLEQEEIEVAATCLAFYLTAGLSAGSFLSFAVRAATCRCNPFDDAGSGFSSLTWALIVMLALVTTAAVVLGVILLKTPKSAPASSADGSGSPSPTGTDVTPTATGDTASPTATETGTTPPSTAVPASGFLGSLAASYTVTPAAVRTLAMPSSAIPSPSAAVSYIDSSWTRNKGGSAETLSFVDDPLDAGGGPVLQVVYKKGSYSGGGVGGIGNWQFPVFGEKKNRAVLSYEVGFSKDFDFVKGGKARLFGGDTSSGCTGGRASTNCFSLRLMWRDKGAGEVYAYIPTYSGFCGTSASPTSVFCHQDDYGASIDRGAFSFAAGSWTTVTQVAILNSAPDKANGILELYVGEKAVIQLNNVIFRTNTSVFINALTFSTFFGGSTTDYAATADCWTYYRNFQFFEGDAASSTNGLTQSAAKVGS
ncbi:hypothetical protein JCM10020v2_002252 [Rhodotorula toruloides]